MGGTAALALTVDYNSFCRDGGGVREPERIAVEVMLSLMHEGGRVRGHTVLARKYYIVCHCC
jgi:hypothetical protein